MAHCPRPTLKGPAHLSSSVYDVDMTTSNEFADAHPDIADTVARWSELVAPHLIPNHCIFAARTLTRMHENCTAAPVVGLVANNLAHNLLPYLNGRRLEDVNPDAWTVGFAGQDRIGPNGYDGHMVVTVDDRWVVDLSAPQFDRSRKGIRVPGPMVFDLTRADHGGSALFPDAYVWNLRDVAPRSTGWVHYQFTNDGRWRTARDWHARDRTDRAIEALRTGVWADPI